MCLARVIQIRGGGFQPHASLSLFSFITAFNSPSYIGSECARRIMAEIMTLLKPIHTTALDRGGGGEDIAPWMEAGVPGASLKNDNDKYFYFHHSYGK